MPLYEVNGSKRQLIEMQPVTFESEGWLERTNLQPLLRDHPQAIDPDLMIISEEFQGWDETAKRKIDLLGLDRQGNLVVIELKRVEGGGHMELQALRYAAMVSAMDFDGVVDTYQGFLAGLGTRADDARETLESFLQETDAPAISNHPRIALVAPGFSREITTTVLWLNEQGLDIRCLEANLYSLNGRHYLDIEQVIPLPSASDYIVRLREKQRAERHGMSRGEQLHLEFWTQFQEFLDQRGSSIPMASPPKISLSSVNLGQSRFRIRPWNLLKNRSGVWICFSEPEAAQLYERTASRHRHRVEKKLSGFGDVVWLEKERRVSLRRDSSILQRETWPELNEWMADAIEAAIDLFSQIVIDLDQERTSQAPQGLDPDEGGDEA